MDRLQNRVILSALALMASGLLFGLFISVAPGHESRFVQREDYLLAFELAAGGNVRSSEIALSATAHNQRTARAMDFHAHSINLGILVFLAAWYLPMLRSQTRLADPTVTVLAAAAWIYPLGLILQFFGLVKPGEIAAAIGAALIVGGFAVFGWRIVQYSRQSTPPRG